MIVGIDLGTTNSSVAVWRDGRAEIIPNALGHNLTPSVVGLDETGEILVGMAARERLITHPGQTAAVFKRYMGSPREFAVGRRKFRPEELSSFVLRALKADAEAFLDAEVREAVISVPAYFNDAQRKATRAAGQLAGLKVERLINEPTAAALAYSLERREVESKFLVFDLGGGTFDVSILELFEGVMEVRATAGDNFLGGEDFVESLVAGFLDWARKSEALDERDLDSRLRQALWVQGERAKRAITKRETGVMTLNIGGKEVSWSIDEDTFAGLCQPLLDRLRAPCERALRDARIRASELDEMVLVGGATRMPSVRRLAAQLFGRLPTVHLNPDEVVTLGAAVQAGLKARDAALDEVVLTDVCPYSLGIQIVQSLGRDQVRDGLFAPILERNTTIPASRVERFCTVIHYQQELRIDIYQGEARQVKDNIHLGQTRVKLPSKPAGEESVDVRFTYDINGLLEVEATVVSTGESQSIVIEGNPGVLSAEEIEKRLAELGRFKIHPREREENRAVMARAERLYEELLGDHRDFVGRQIAHFEAILERQVPEEISEARQRFTELLNQLEGTPYL
ncbi:MAG: molecular chaperone HscC [Proteobacteria bacterium]|nr:molecular chaperone HscC [Pseudomonadota bacterium]